MKTTIAITMGDPAGIGPELCLKAGRIAEMQKEANLRFYVSLRILERQAVDLGIEVPKGPGIEYVDVGDQRAEFPMGEVSAEAGRLSALCLEKAVDAAIAGEVDAVVTTPISKDAWRAAGLGYPGHTEYLAERTGTDDFGMMLVSEPLRILHLSAHCSLRRAIEMVTEPRIIRMGRLLARTLSEMGMPNPKIAVAGLNPHSGENGMFGDEEQTTIIPAIDALRQDGIDAVGPVVPDTLFARGRTGEFDGILAMYHDQGHVALKTLMFEPGDSGRLRSVRGVNVTVGLPVIRTSVDHGVAFDIAGKGVASVESLVDAALLAVRMARGRKALSRSEARTGE